MTSKKSFGTKIKEKLHYGGLTREEYGRIVPDICQKNYVTLRISAVLGTVLLLCLLVASHFLPILQETRGSYVIFFFVFGVILLLVLLLGQGHRRATTALLYALLSAAYAFGINVGTVSQPAVTATTFCVLIFALPLMVVDMPIRCNLLVVLATVCFCICAVAYKEPLTAQRDLVNAICFLLLGVVVNHHVMETKLRDLLNQNYVTQERDTDQLTGLLNGAAGRREIEAYFVNDPAPASFLIIDIDHFKDCNDTCGHAYGDAVLHMMGQSMRATCQPADIPVRMGGDEFLMLLPGITRRAQLEERLERLFDALHGLDTEDERLAALTASVGAAVFPTDSMSYNTLYHMADKAPYAAKDSGRNRLLCYNELEK